MMKMRLLALLLMVMLSCSTAIAQQPDMIDINTADVAALVKHIKGIGAKKAEAIVQYRDENGPFKSVDDLIRVSGIGKKTLDANRDILTASNQ